MGTSLRECAKRDWGTIGESPTTDELRTGCMLLIADAAHSLRQSVVALMRDRDYWKSEAATLKSERTALRGKLTKLTRQQARKEPQ